MNVSSNYFPVDSAIAIRDHDLNKPISLQATVMNERSQGGSAGLYGSNIEIC